MPKNESVLRYVAALMLRRQQMAPPYADGGGRRGVGSQTLFRFPIQMLQVLLGWRAISIVLCGDWQGNGII